MSADPEILLSRLQDVRSRGPRSWVARCPAHQDRRPSLSIRLTDQGIWLLHCFAGCAATDVLAAVGLELADLFPARPSSGPPGQRPRFPWRDLMLSLQERLTVIALSATDLAEGRQLNRADLEGLAAAARYLAGIIESVRHER